LPETPYIELKSSTLTKRVALTAAAISVSLCFAANSNAASAQENADVPEYTVINAFQASGVNEVRVTTEEAREAEMRLIADELRDEGNVPEDGTLLVEYYDSADTAENTGFALVFDNEDAVLDTGTTEQFGEVYDREDAERIIEEEGAMRVVSNEEFAEENASIWDRIKGFFA